MTNLFTQLNENPESGKLTFTGAKELIDTYICLLEESVAVDDKTAYGRGYLINQLADLLSGEISPELFIHKMKITIKYKSK